ncbi:MAG TPA: glycosyltransferase family 4 protein [Myxococcota bacterium]|nr:glycosyltransferase family 4 protein [Myxococcota bacterium]
MKILQVTSDWKWTGPAEPLLRLALALRDRGHEVSLAVPEPPSPSGRSLASEARAAGLAPSLALSRGRGLALPRDARDVRALRAFRAAHGVELVHAWHTRDHLLAFAATAGRRKQTALVRSVRSADPPSATPWTRWLLGPATDALVCVSPGSAERWRPIRGARPIFGVFGAVDPTRFHSARNDPSVREALGLKPEHRVVGIVARVQPHRRFDLVLKAAAELFRVDAAARLLVIGRGTRHAELAQEPAARLGIADRVVFAGYRTEDYAEILRAIDVFTLLVPGSDGTCRALLEAAMCGVPAVVSPRGALPELVVHDQTGLVVPETCGALAEAWGALLRDADRREALGRAAAERARRLFVPERFAAEVEAIYAAALRARC